MNVRRAKPEAWDLSDDEIASITSDDLHRHRPNRWRGPASTWRGLTEEERLLWRSMKTLSDRDLAVHLYDAFALRRRAMDPATAQDVTVRMADGREVLWMPPKAWTAWPVELENLPREDLLGNEQGPHGDEDGQGDEDEGFTYRNVATSAEAKMPSSNLHEELSATVLRMAKRRFMRRRGVGRYQEYQPGQSEPEPEPEEGEEEDGERDEEDGPSQSSPATAWDTDTDHESRAQTTDPSEGHTSDTQGPKRKRARAAGSPRTYRAAVATDDDRSYDLLAAPVRHILSQTDRTLHILHTLRASGISYQSDSSTDAESDSSHGSRVKKGLRRDRRGAEEKKQSQARRGHVNDGELSDRQQRRASSARSEADDAFETWLRNGDKAASELATNIDMKQEEEEEEEEKEGGEEEADGDGSEDDVPRVSSSKHSSRRSMRHRLRLRDWSDVMGAAAIAGFPQAVIARATQRCADLFGEGMVLRRLDETPAATNTSHSIGVTTRGIQMTEYRPEPITLSPSAWDDPWSSSDEGRHTGPSPVLQLRRHIHSRQASQSSHNSPATTTHGPSPSPGPRGRRSPSVAPSRSVSRPRGQPTTTTGSPPTVASSPAPSARSRSTSRARSSSVGQHFCPVPTCDRAVHGFARRANLKRHTELVHGRGLAEGGQQQQPHPQPQQQQQQLPVTPLDMDSDDEMVGAVHVDGFLRTLVPGRGWRGEDIMPRKRDGYRGQRRAGGQESRGPSRGWTEDEGSE